MPDTAALLEEIDALKAMLIASEARSQRRDDRIGRLEKLVAAFRQAAFGRRSERSDPDQFELALEDLETAIAAIHAEEDAEDRAAKRPARPRAANRGSLPAHLPRIDEVIEPASLTCGGGGCLHRIGEDVSGRLDVIPAQFRVIVTRRPKYACRSCTDGVVQAPAPARLIPGGMPTEATVAHVLVSKYADHLPLYRQAQIYSRQGVDLDRSTLADRVGRAAFELRPVYDALMADLKRSTKLFMDETRAPVLDPGARKTRTGYFWALARDDRPWGGTAPPGCGLHLRPRPRRAACRTDPAGVWRYPAGRRLCRIQPADRTGPDRTRHPAGLLLGPCAPKAHRDHPRGTGTDRQEGVALIRELYAIEADIRAAIPPPAWPHDRTLRAHPRPPRRLAAPSPRPRVSQVRPCGEALAYIARYRDGLGRFLSDGRIEIDSNAVERTIRPIALNRKNALFAGHDAGAENWAVIASLIETCKLNGVDPWRRYAHRHRPVGISRARSTISCPGTTPPRCDRNTAYGVQVHQE